jgi:DNA-binding NtrC family response regulator
MSHPPASSNRVLDLFIHCVLLTSIPADFTFLRNVMGVAGIRMHQAESLEEADFLLTVTGSTVLVTDLIFPDGTWRDALAVLGARHPLVPMLVTADREDRPMLADVFDRGACGVIWKPFEFEASRRLIRAVHEAYEERRILQEELVSPPA